MTLAETVAAVLAEHGEAMTLARASHTSITVMGKRLTGTTDEVGGSAEQQRFRVKIGTAELDASAWSSKVPSASTDTLTVGGRVRTVVDVRPIGDGGTVAIYELEVVG